MYIRDRVLPEFFDGKGTVLDVACRHGEVARQLEMLGHEVTCVDRENVLKLFFHFTQSDLNEQGLSDVHGQYDTIWLGDILEHLENVHLVMVHASNMTDRVVLSVPNIGYWYYRWQNFKTGTPQFGECPPKSAWLYEHIRAFNARIIEQMLNAYGFKMTKLVGVNDDKLWFQNFMCKFRPDLFASILVAEGKK